MGLTARRIFLPATALAFATWGHVCGLDYLLLRLFIIGQ